LDDVGCLCAVRVGVAIGNSVHHVFTCCCYMLVAASAISVSPYCIPDSIE
jgi:hypothetical protein